MSPRARAAGTHALVAWGSLACAGLHSFAAADQPGHRGRSAALPGGLRRPCCRVTPHGAGLIVGCAGLLLLRHQAVTTASSGPAREDAALARRGYGLLAALLTLAVTGLLALVLRDTAAFGLVLVVHLAAVVACLAIAPYTKFMHVIYRFLALVHDNAEASGP